MKRISLLFTFLLIICFSTQAWAGFGGFLREDTAVDVLIGPFVDDADGDTADTDATLDVELSKNGQALANKNDATAPVHDAAGDVDGYYNCELDATDTNTPGLLTLVIHHADDLPIRLDFQVVSAIIYDSLLGAAATDYLPVDVVQYNGNAVTATVSGIPDVNVTYYEDDAVPSTADGLPAVNVEEWNDTDVPADVQAGYPTVTVKDGTGTGEIDTDSGTVLLRSATETQIDNIETDTAAQDTSTEIRTLMTGSDTAVSTVTTANLDTACDTVTVTSIGANVITDASMADDVDTLVNDEVAAALTTYDPPTDTEMLAAHTTTDALINGIDDNPWDDGTRTLTATGLDAVLKTSTFALAMGDAIWDEATAGHVGAGSTGLALGSLYSTIVVRVAQCGDAGSATTIDLDASASAVTDFYKGQLVAIVLGTGAGQARTCTGYAGDTKIATISPTWATNPDGDSYFAILNTGSTVVVDWADGGRLDLILDTIAADTTTDIPAKLLKYVQLLARSDAAIATDNATELTAINADGGSGAGDFSNQTDADEALKDHIGNGTNLTEAGGDGDHLTAINLPNQTMDITGSITGSLSGSVGSVTGAVGSVAGNVDGNVTGTVGTVNALAANVITAASINADAITEAKIADNAIAAEHIAANAIGDAELAADVDTLVNDEVKDVLTVDTIAELTGKADLAATPTFAKAVILPYMMARNQIQVTATEWRLFNDAGTEILDKELTDDGTTFQNTEIDDDD